MPKARSERLSIQRIVHVPLEEVSGICLRREADGRTSLIAIGDRAAVAAWALIPDEDDGAYEWSEMDITGVAGSQMPMKNPQIEAVCADGEGRVLLLQEDPARVELLDWKDRKVIAMIDLELPADHPLSKAWLDPEGSKGEGAVLLKNGHLLIAKEKDPPAFIEFGPAGERPSGCGAQSVLPDGAPWPIEAGQHTFVALATWMPTAELLEVCADFSDLEVGPDKRLYLLSDKSASICRLHDLTPDTEHARAESSWRLKDVEGKPEGLAFSRHGRAIVALDTRRARNNLVILDPPIVTWW